jgi:hypothetical protein
MFTAPRSETHKHEEQLYACFSDMPALFAFILASNCEAV